MNLSLSRSPIRTTSSKRRCRLVHLSDGARAALWRGLAWPIGDDDRIDVAGLALPLLPEASPVTPGFGLIEAEEDAWLVLHGSVTVRDAAVAALRQAGVEVLRSGPWLGDPVDSAFRQGSARVDCKSYSKECPFSVSAGRPGRADSGIDD
jgi:hypothetical protein